MSKLSISSRVAPARAEKTEGKKSRSVWRRARRYAPTKPLCESSSLQCIRTWQHPLDLVAYFRDDLIWRFFPCSARVSRLEVQDGVEHSVGFLQLVRDVRIAVHTKNLRLVFLRKMQEVVLVRRKVAVLWRIVEARTRKFVPVLKYFGNNISRER